jgi:hypothetical protein
VSSREFLPMARVMLSGVRAVHPDVRLVLAAAEPGVCENVRADDPFEVIALERIGIPDVDAFRARYSLSQQCIAAKAFLLRELLRQGHPRALFLDADICVYAPLDPVLSPPAGASIVLTPHLLQPVSGSSRAARERNILQSGTFNGGAVGVCAGSEAERFLDWWCDRLFTDCRHDLAAGLHNDQRWLDLAPACCPNLHIVRDAGCNVAYWNLPERPVEIRDDGIHAGGQRLRFFHFSGFDSRTPDRVSRYAPWIAAADTGGAAALFARFAAAIEARRALTDILV